MKQRGEHYLMTIRRDLRGRFDTVRTKGGNAEQLSLLLTELDQDDRAPSRPIEEETT